MAVRQDVVYGIERWAKSLVENGHFKDFTDVFSGKRLARFSAFGIRLRTGSHSLGQRKTSSYIRRMSCRSKRSKN